jgi:hypothetical protein
MSTNAFAQFDAKDTPERLTALAAQITDLRPLWALTRIKANGWLREQFETEGDFGGRAWAPLSPVYRETKANLKPGNPILVFNGALKRAATALRPVSTPRMLMLFVDDPKAEWHQDGTSRMPARQIIPDPFPPTQVAEIERMTDEYFQSLIDRLGLS